MKRAIALGILVCASLLGPVSCSDDSSGTTQGNTGQKEKKIPVPPPRQLECQRPDAETCSEDCCPNRTPTQDFKTNPGCKAWLGSDPVAKCKAGVSDRDLNLFAPRE